MGRLKQLYYRLWVLNPHARSHPWALWVAGVAPTLLGILLMLSPEAGGSSPSLAAMPPVGIVVWGVAFALAGLGILGGLLLHYERSELAAKSEAAGFAILAGCILASLLSTLLFFPNPLSVIFLGCMVVGAIHRSRILVRGAPQ